MEADEFELDAEFTSEPKEKPPINSAPAEELIFKPVEDEPPPPDGFVSQKPGGEPLDLSGESFQGVKLTQQQLKRANLVGCDFSGSDLFAMDFSMAKMQGATFGEAKISQSFFRYTRLKGVLFKGAVLKDVNFEAADLRGTNFSGCTFEGVVWAEADVAGAIFPLGFIPEGAKNADQIGHS